MRGFAAAQRAYDNMSPPEQEERECDECGEIMQRTERDDGYICPSCGFTEDDPEQDFYDIEGEL